MSEKLKKLINFEVIMPVIMFIFALTYFLDMSDKPMTGRLFPQVVCVVLLLLLARVMIVNIAKKLASETRAVEVAAVKAEKVKFSERKGLELFTFIAMMFIYYFAILLVGYVYSTFVFVIASMLVLGYKNKKAILLVSVIFLLVIYVFFVLGFHFVLPQGSFIKGL